MVVDRVGHIPIDPKRASLGCSASCQPIRTDVDDRHLKQAVLGMGEIFGDDTAATAMIERLIDHSEILSLKADSLGFGGNDPDALAFRVRPQPTRTHPPSAATAQADPQVA